MLLKFVENLGNGGGVIAMLVALVILDRRVGGRLPQLLAASLGAGLIADGLKLCVDRGRPYSLDLATATGREIVVIVSGAAAMLLVAAGIEAFWSGSSVPSIVKHVVGTTAFVLVVLYLALAGRGGRRA